MNASLARDLVPLAEAIIADEKARGDAASRFRMAMGESALAMAAREANGQEALMAAEQVLAHFGDALVDKIRAGAPDGDPALYQSLLELAERRTAITRPSAVER